MKLVGELKERRFIPLLTGYLAGGWVVLEVVDQLTGNGVIPAISYPLALTLLLCGIPAVGVIAWFHGARGDQKPPPIEIMMLGAIGVVAIGATALVARNWLADPELVAAIDRLDATEDPRRIAVTYFDAVGGEDAEFLATGITETLIDELSRVPQVHVVSRNGVAPLRDRTSFPTDSVAEALQVGTFVRGTVSAGDSLVKVRVEVVRAKGDRNVGSNTFERPRSELFQLQDDIAAQVGLFLRETVGEEVSLVEDAPQTENVEAWLLVQEAGKREAEASRLVALDDQDGALARTGTADSLLAAAGRLAPDWSVPPTRRGWLAYQQARWGGFNRAAIPELLADGLVHANRALGVNPADADALELRATIKYWSYLLNLSQAGQAEQLLAEAEADFNAATSADPNQASAYSSLSHLLMNRGRTAQAKLAAEKSYETDPWLQNANLTLWRLFQASLDLQDDQEARSWCDAGAERFPEDFRFHECRVWLYSLPTPEPAARADSMKQAWTQCEAVVALSPPSIRDFNRKRCEMLIAMGLVQAGLPDSARSVALRARSGPDVDPIRELAWLEGIVLTWLGDRGAAVDRLAVYLAANPGQVAAFARDDTWWLQDLRAEPAYQRLVGTR